MTAQTRRGTIPAGWLGVFVSLSTRGSPSTDSGQAHTDNFGSLGSNNYVQELEYQSGMD